MAAVYHYFEDKIKGSIKPGDLEDVVVLDNNQLNVETMETKDIKVIETIKEGKTIYRCRRLKGLGSFI